VRSLVLREWARFDRNTISTEQLQALQDLDERNAKSSGETVFDWSLRAEVRVRNWVGVLQVPGLTIEILPKLGSLDEATTRRNLVHMLSVCRALPFRDRDIAAMSLDRLPLIEAVILKFAQRLLTELQRGPDQAYLTREENSAYVRGKILLSEHLRRNVVSSERVYVSYDELRADTWLNRILKYVCGLLLGRSRVPWTQRCLRDALLHLDEVQDLAIELHHLDRVHLNRGTERFRDLLEFCRIVVAGTGILPRTGEVRSFSFLFPMDVVFEEFIANTIRRHSAALGIDRQHIHAQARGNRRWLLRDSEGQGRFRLVPDILITNADRTPQVIIDTKWKRLVPDDQDSRSGVAQSDIYQLYAYSQRYGSRDSVLLFPSVEGASAKRYILDGDAATKTLRVEFVDLACPLLRSNSQLLKSLHRVIHGPSGAATVSAFGTQARS